jgi:hypothetical protein
MRKVEDLSLAELDWYVAKIEGKPVNIINDLCIYVGPVDTWATPGTLKGILTGQKWNPSTRHGIGGLIMDREFIGTAKHIGSKEWKAWYENGKVAWGPTRLVAAMRCFVANKLGNEVPDIVDDYEVKVQVS